MMVVNFWWIWHLNKLNLHLRRMNKLFRLIIMNLMHNTLNANLREVQMINSILRLMTRLNICWNHLITNKEISFSLSLRDSMEKVYGKNNNKMKKVLMNNKMREIKSKIRNKLIKMTRIKMINKKILIKTLFHKMKSNYLNHRRILKILINNKIMIIKNKTK